MVVEERGPRIGGARPNCAVETLRPVAFGMSAGHAVEEMRCHLDRDPLGGRKTLAFGSTADGDGVMSEDKRLGRARGRGGTQDARMEIPL